MKRLQACWHCFWDLDKTGSILAVWDILAMICWLKYRHSLVNCEFAEESDGDAASDHLFDVFGVGLDGLGDCFGEADSEYLEVVSFVEPWDFVAVVESPISDSHDVGFLFIYA